MTLVLLGDIGRHWFFAECLPEVFQDSPMTSGFCTEEEDERTIDMIANMKELTQAEDMAYFKADLCLYSPESYTLEEKRDICSEMISTSGAILDAMRADFEQLPSEARSKLLAMLCESGTDSSNWWWDVLVGEGDPLYRSMDD